MRGWIGWFAFLEKPRGATPPASIISPEPAPTIDPKGHFPHTGKPVTIEIIGAKPITFQEASEPIWGLVLQATMWLPKPPTIIFAESPEGACRMFTIISWDPGERRLVVRWSG